MEIDKKSLDLSRQNLDKLIQTPLKLGKSLDKV